MKYKQWIEEGIKNDSILPLKHWFGEAAECKNKNKGNEKQVPVFDRDVKRNNEIDQQDK